MRQSSNARRTRSQRTVMPVAPVSAITRPWWEWVVFCLAVFGGVKTLWDWIVLPFRQRPKLSGTLEKTPVLRGHTTSSPQSTRTADLAAAIDAAFDAEIRLSVCVYNKRQQPTSLKKWVLRVQAEGRQQQELAPLPHNALSQRKGPYIDPTSLMPETIKFEWRSPVCGWLYFRCPNIRSRMLGSAKYTLFAVDIDDRKHRVVSSRFPPASKENTNVLSVLGDSAAAP